MRDNGLVSELGHGLACAQEAGLAQEPSGGNGDLASRARTLLTLGEPGWPRDGRGVLTTSSDPDAERFPFTGGD